MYILIIDEAMEKLDLSHTVSGITKCYICFGQYIASPLSSNET